VEYTTSREFLKNAYEAAGGMTPLRDLIRNIINRQPDLFSDTYMVTAEEVEQVLADKHGKVCQGWKESIRTEFPAPESEYFLLERDKLFSDLPHPLIASYTVDHAFPELVNRCIVYDPAVHDLEIRDFNDRDDKRPLKALAFKIRKIEENSCEYWLSKIEDPKTREAALTNHQVYLQRHSGAVALNIGEAISYGFIWRQTKESDEFWEGVMNHYQKGKPLPAYPSNL
jgi:hypothetical protein